MSTPIVSVHAYRRVKKDHEVLKRLLNGEWVDKDDVCTAMGITFTEAMQMFEYGRMAKWNPAPLNGQRVVEKFRISEKTLKTPQIFWCDEDDFKPAEIKAEVNQDTHQWELILEQQGGII